MRLKYKDLEGLNATNNEDTWHEPTYKVKTNWTSTNIIQWLYIIILHTGKNYTMI